MITTKKIELLVAQHLGEGTIFLTGIKISADNHINVFIDGDNGVSISDCVALSRYLEKALNENNELFSLDVSSHGANSPIVLERQYPKHIGRDFIIKLTNGEKLEGCLKEVTKSQLQLEYQTRENKPVGKGKVTVTKQHIININQIQESKIKLKF
ncbi:MAG: ribosome assembly cofactor RimP [Bacteroidetes bacterium]|nr:ribosome assembly cofactor RimP [Bacteroidota bacterium]